MYSSALLGCALHYILHRVRDFYVVILQCSAPPLSTKCSLEEGKDISGLAWIKLICSLCTQFIDTNDVDVCLCLCLQFYVFGEYSQQKEVKSNDLHLRHGHPITVEKEFFVFGLTFVCRQQHSNFLSPFRPRQLFFFARNPR